MAGNRNALAPVTNELQKNVAYALNLHRVPGFPLVHVPCLQKLTPTKSGSNMHFLGHSYADFYRKVFPWPGKHPALTLAAVKPYLQRAAAREGFGSSSLLRTRWRSFSGSKKASKK
jgi:hypothetical protein